MQKYPPYWLLAGNRGMDARPAPRPPPPPAPVLALNPKPVLILKNLVASRFMSIPCFLEP